MSTTYTEAVGAYAGHLRSGGTTPWSTWCGSSRTQPWPDSQAETSAAQSGRRPVPSSTHLELLRRINEQSGASLPGLADLVLATPAPGRGRVDVPVPWTHPESREAQPHRFGSPPIDPALLPDEELVRLAVGVLTRLLPRVPTPQAHPELTRWPVPWRRRFRLHGSPGTVAVVRAGLLTQGLVETDWRPVHVVLARPLEVMMAEHWASATARGAHQRWSTLWRRAQAADVLPPPLDVVAIAERLADSPGRRDPVHLVVARTPGEAVAETARVLRARAFDPRHDPDAAQVDLLRRLNRQTAITPGPAHVRRLALTLAGILEQTSPRAPGAAPPRTARAWARRTAAHAAQRARAAGYAVHGDPDALVPPDSDRTGQPGPTPGPTSGTVDPRHTLAVAVEACVRAWSRQEESS